MAQLDRRPSEFGGRPGLIQRLEDGHTPDAAEKAYLIRQVDPSPLWVNGELIREDLPEGLDPGEQVAP